MATKSKMPTMEPPGAVSTLSEEFDRRFRRAQIGSAEWRNQAREFYKTYGGNPWPAGVKEMLEEEGRPATTFNYSLSYINAVLGQDIADRKEARFEGQGGDVHDEFVAEVYTKLVRALYMKCNGFREEIEAEQDQLVTGVGCMEAMLDTSKFPILPAAESVDIQEMFWDPDTKKHNLRDARWVARRRLWYIEDAVARWPNKASELRALAATQQSGGRQGGILPRKAKASGYTDRSQKLEDSTLMEDHLYIFDYQFKRPTKVVVYLDPRDGQRKKASPEEFKAIQAEIFAAVDPETGVPLHENVEAAELFVKKVYRAFLAGNEAGQLVEVEKERELETEMFTYRFATGYRSKTESGRVQFFGLMQLIYEPQLWTAKAISAAIEHLARSPKGGGGFINSDILVDPSDFKQNGSKPGHWALVNANTTSIRENVYERQAPPFHQAYERLFEIAENAMGQLTTITDYFKGTASGERSNILVRNLQGQTIMVLNPLIDPMNQMRVEMALLIAKLAQLHLAPVDFNKLVGDVKAVGVTHEIAKDPMTGQEMWMGGEPVLQPLTVLDEETGQPMPLTPYDISADREVFDFDIQVDLGPASVTQKQAVWSNITSNAFFQETLKSLPQVGNRLMPYVVKHMPGIAADEARQIEKDIREELRMMKMQGTLQGVMESLPQLPPEAIQQIHEMTMQMVESMMQPQPQPGGPAAQAPPQ